MHGLNLGIGSFEILILSVAGLLLFRRELVGSLRSLRLFILDVRDSVFRW